MSADNWAICPRCQHRARLAAEAESERVSALYGKVPVAEFDEARAALTPVDPEEFRTFREDYEFYGATDGTVQAHYSGACTVCSLRVRFQHDEHFWSPEDYDPDAELSSAELHETRKRG